MPVIVYRQSVKALAEALGTKFPMLEIRNDVTRKPGAKLTVNRAAAPRKGGDPRHRSA